MTPPPTGRLLAAATGTDLEMTREYKASIEEVWASITEPERTARWFAHWSGEGRPGATVRLRLVHEEGEPESDMTIIACEPPRRLEVDEVRGRGPLVGLVGAPMDAAAFEPLANLLATDHTVLTTDPPGHQPQPGRRSRAGLDTAAARR